METQQLIKASADVVTIVTLRPGDVYKRLHTAYAGSGSELRFGVVQSAMNNGEDSAVTALEYVADYGRGIIAELKVWDGGQPMALYPAEPEEVRTHLDELCKSAERKVSDARKALLEAERVMELAQRLEQQVSTGTLTSPHIAASVETARAIRGELIAAQTPQPVEAESLPGAAPEAELGTPLPTRDDDTGEVGF